MTPIFSTSLSIQKITTKYWTQREKVEAFEWFNICLSSDADLHELPGKSLLKKSSNYVSKSSLAVLPPLKLQFSSLLFGRFLNVTIKSLAPVEGSTSSSLHPWISILRWGLPLLNSVLTTSSWFFVLPQS